MFRIFFEKQFEYLLLKIYTFVFYGHFSFFDEPSWHVQEICTLFFFFCDFSKVFPTQLDRRLISFRITERRVISKLVSSRIKSLLFPKFKQLLLWPMLGDMYTLLYLLVIQRTTKSKNIFISELGLTYEDTLNNLQQYLHGDKEKKYTIFFKIFERDAKILHNLHNAKHLKKLKASVIQK